MNNILFSNSFNFRKYRYERSYRYTDKRSGADQHFIAYMRAGRCRIASEQGILEINEGDIFYIPNNLRYQSYWYGEGAIFFDSFGFQFFPNREERTYPLQKIPSADAQVQLVEQVTGCDENSSQAIFLFYALLGQLIPKMVYEDSHNGILREAERFLYTNPFSQIAQVAEACGISESGLYAAFKRLGGYTPNTLRQKVLVDKAVQLLTETDISVEEISSRLRFSSTAYFRKVLKKHIGLTPRQIRKESSF